MPPPATMTRLLGRPEGAGCGRGRARRGREGTSRELQDVSPAQGRRFAFVAPGFAWAHDLSGDAESAGLYAPRAARLKRGATARRGGSGRFGLVEGQLLVDVHVLQALHRRRSASESRSRAPGSRRPGRSGRGGRWPRDSCPWCVTVACREAPEAVTSRTSAPMPSRLLRWPTSLSVIQWPRLPPSLRRTYGRSVRPWSRRRRGRRRRPGRPRPGREPPSPSRKTSPAESPSVGEAPALVAREQGRLTVAQMGRRLLDRVHHVALGHEEVLRCRRCRSRGSERPSPSSGGSSVPRPEAWVSYEKVPSPALR